jgi:hypothetical protein
MAHPCVEKPGATPWTPPSMLRPASAHRLATAGFRAAIATLLLAGLAAECLAIEMFTFFGDGSRVGLPSLEVPVEAYPGIPLRSDRLRARRAARRQAAPEATAMPGQPALRRGITIREMPATNPPMPRMQPTSRKPTAAPIAPAPEDLMPELVRPPLAE